MFFFSVELVSTCHVWLVVIGGDHWAPCIEGVLSSIGSFSLLTRIELVWLEKHGLSFDNTVFLATREGEYRILCARINSSFIRDHPSTIHNLWAGSHTRVRVPLRQRLLCLDCVFSEFASHDSLTFGVKLRQLLNLSQSWAAMCRAPLQSVIVVHDERVL